MKRYILIWFSDKSILSSRIINLRRLIEDTVKDDRENVEIDIWLETPGGDAHAAFKLALMVRDAAARIRVVVPDVAKSAGTLLALVGDEIFLAPGADLGPLDAQMPEEGSLTGQMSALNIARAADEVARDAVELAVQSGATLLHATGLTRAQTIEAMLRFSGQFTEPLVRQLDPRVVYDAKQLLRVTARYANRLLDNLPGKAAIASSLVEDFPSHGFVIDIKTAEELGLPVRPIRDYDLLDAMRSMHRRYEDGDRDVIFFCDAGSFLGETDASEDSVEEQVEEPAKPKRRPAKRNGGDA